MWRDVACRGVASGGRPTSSSRSAGAAIDRSIDLSSLLFSSRSWNDGQRRSFPPLRKMARRARAASLPSHTQKRRPSLHTPNCASPPPLVVIVVACGFYVWTLDGRRRRRLSRLVFSLLARSALAASASAVGRSVARSLRAGLAHQDARPARAAARGPHDAAAGNGHATVI